MKAEPSPEPPASLQILHLEDNLPDRELVAAILKQGGLQCRFTHAATQSEYAAALRSGGHDLILSDFTLPSYDGATALALARTVRPEVPFIFVSGTISMERALDALKNGATDFVLKDNLERLLPAVQRARREMVERKLRWQAEAALRASEERFREMAENAREVFWSTTPDGRQLHYVSPAYAQVWGHPLAELQAAPASWLAAVVREDRGRLATALTQLAQGVPYHLEYRLTHADGSIRCIEERGYPVRDPAGVVVRRVAVATDITEHKRLQEQLQQTMKMESIGQLAGGVAHDFNNVLTVINGRASLLLDHEKGLSPEVVDSLKQIYVAGERATNLTRQLLVFSRQQAVDRRPVDLNELIEEVTQMLRSLIGEHLVLNLCLARPLPLIEADNGMMEQILLNLAVNARDAMPNAGQLTISTSRRMIDQDHVERHAQARTGEFISLAVTDTGCGIPPQVMTRIFEPFFTTKPVGQGTGLGLATVFGIVKQHDGWLEVESEVGAGTTFRVFLPAMPASTARPRPPSKPPIGPGGKETILLVEDEAPVREFSAAVLQKYGYSVLQAVSGVEALEVWKWYAPRIVLLVTDIVMPDGLSGIELAEKLQRDKPGLPVVLVSGYNQEMFGQMFKPRPLTRILYKPFLPAILAAAVREALDSVKPPAA